ncbi:MAG: DUF996 domain-containing protein [Crenarchaeota archaeon]|nr:DUF996 domain-containing protein [Thermoproteota archaeon]
MVSSAAGGSPPLDYGVSKLVALVGAALGALGVANEAVGLLGTILYLVGFYSLSRYYREERMFYYALYSSVAWMVAAAVFAGLVAGAVFGGAALVLVALALGLLLLWGAAIVAGYYKQRLMELLAPHGDAKLAGLAGKLYWYGGLAAIIIVGLVIQSVAMLVEVVVILSLQPPGGGG